MTDVALKENWLPALYDVAFDHTRRSKKCLYKDVPRSKQDVRGNQVYLAFLKEIGWSWRAMSEFGYTPTGSPAEFAEGLASMSAMASALQVTETAIKATEGDISRIGDILSFEMRNLQKTFPLMARNAFWLGSTGTLGKGAGAISTLTVTLDNDGLNHTSIRDRAKYFVRGMFVQMYDTSNNKVGDPVKITSTNEALGTITLASDPGYNDNYYFVSADVAGLESAISGYSPGILDVVDDNNTFQGINRSTAGNEMFQANIDDNSGTPRDLQYEAFTDWLYEIGNPEKAYTHYRIIRKYFNDNLKSKQRFVDTGAGTGYADDFASVQIGNTMLVPRDDCHHDKIIVIDPSSLKWADKGGMEDLLGMGWQQTAGRPFLERNLVWWNLLYATEMNDGFGGYFDLDPSI